MRPQDMFLLSPVISLVALALLVMVVDWGERRKGRVLALASGGLLLPFLFLFLLWGELNGWWSLLSPLPGEREGVSLPGVFHTIAVDRFALFFGGLFLGSAFLVLLASEEWLAQPGRSVGEYCVLLLLATAGMVLLASATELVSLYIALELTALPLVALAALQRDPRSSEAGLKFLLLSGISSAVLLYGMALVFGFAGSTWLRDIREAVAGSGGAVPFGSPVLLVGLVLMAAGFGFKVASVPFQMWVPDVYEGAPTPITAYLSVASKAAGFAVLLRVFYLAFGPVQEQWALLFAGLSAASMTIGNLVAIAQNNIKRMLAYSTIAHAGYMLVGVAAVAARAPEGAALGPGTLLFYLAAYAFTNLGAFFAVIAITHRVGSEAIDRFAGIGRRSPLLALALAFSLVSLIGVPPTAGFMAKLFIFSAAVQSGLAWLVVVGVLNSVLSAYYYLRVVRVMFLLPPAGEGPLSSTRPLGSALALAAAGVAVLGILPFPLLRLAEGAARVLLSP